MKKYIAILLSVSTLLLGVQSSLVQAEMISTGTAIHVQSGEISRQNIVDALARQDVAEQLSALGVDVDTARERVQHMTASELTQLNSRMTELPAGAGDIISLMLLVLLILVFLDIFGVTDIFSFINSAK